MKEYEYLRIGYIDKIHYDVSIEERYEKSMTTYFTADIRWEGDCRTNPVEKVTLSFDMVGDGWGIFSMPEEGTRFIAGFRKGGTPIILGYLQKNNIKISGKRIGNKIERNSDDDPISNYPNKDTGFRPIGNPVPGEILIRSKEGSEIYCDKNGTLNLITRETPSSNNKELGNRIITIRIGRIKEKLDSENNLKSQEKNKDVNFELKHKNGLFIRLDTEGNIEWNIPKELKIKFLKGIFEGTILLGGSKDSETQRAILGEALKIAFDNHTHLVANPPPTTTDVPILPLSESVFSEKVKIK